TELTSMLDLGEGAVIANRTGVVTVSGLRRKDNAVGGFGAPLVPFGDWVNFRDERVARVVWNVGGICNATVIPAGEPFEAVWAFDAGPGNMLLDQLATILTDGAAAFDADGAMAARGVVSDELVQVTMRDAFIQRDLPKAAARQLYGEEFTAHFVARATVLNLSGDDMMATATALTAEVIADAQRRFIAPRTPVGELIFAGGGARNPVLMRMVAERVAPVTVRTSDSMGIPVDCREVMAMVMIANETVHGRPSNCLPATGGRQPVAQGHIDIPM
ncbi:MAG: anhydro-N-acetylmuramic acid kinase, partial [Actinotalea sp.]|nr:anhydro-N-acetylmuramic acid kinase [Actinotalea sp.]